MTYGDSCVPVKQHKRYGLADYIASSNYYGIFPLNRYMVMFEEFNNAKRRAWDKSIMTCHQPSHIYFMKSVHIFFRGNGLQDIFLIEPFRQRKLNQYTMNTIVIIELVNKFKQLSLGRIFRQSVLFRVDACCLAGFSLISDIDHRGGIASHAQDREARGYTLKPQLFSLFCDFFPDMLCNCLPIYNLCCHIPDPFLLLSSNFLLLTLHLLPI